MTTETPEDAFDRWRRETAPEVEAYEARRRQNRARMVRPLNTWTLTPAIGVAIVAAGVVIGRILGWPKP